MLDIHHSHFRFVFFFSSPQDLNCHTNDASLYDLKKNVFLKAQVCCVIHILFSRAPEGHSKIIEGFSDAWPSYFNIFSVLCGLYYCLFVCLKVNNPYSCELKFNLLTRDGQRMHGTCTGYSKDKNVNIESETKVNHLMTNSMHKKYFLYGQKR